MVLEGAFKRSGGKAEVVCVGQVVTDHTFRVDEVDLPPSKTTARGYARSVGGMAATAAIAVARLGGRAVFWGRVGRDEAGEELRQALEDEGVDASGLVMAEGARTPLSAVIVDKRGERSIVTYRGERLPTDPSGLPLDRLAEAGALLCDPRWPEAAEVAFRVARARGVPSVMDAEKTEERVLRQLAPLADHVIFAMTGLSIFAPGVPPEEGLARVLKAGPLKLAAVTLGEKGSLWLRPGMEKAGLRPVFPVEATNTTGAGDVFHGAYALALAEGQGVEDALRFASAAGALRARDGRTPDRATLEELLARATDVPPLRKRRAF
ncbi:PfkB family carbohydrate kinase [Roseomonas xinghualingensis]|uniref:PfkB family carbohydrate kinase n=1 Tax=Roseomonas xinghualingensis TaxID=2986475 RepID=UPI0021F173CF|nr:PfkB family carbohydrate kinase [Roseomonas sp. SXEYE001]MCV4209279.1 PfkB family carbohydrate kinase [Roseomonas sp. SXEYE001]